MMEPSGEQFTVYRERWHILWLFAICTMLNAILWISFASIDDETAKFYHVSVAQVNWLAIVFQVLYLPGMLFALYLLASMSLRSTLLIGTAMGAVAGLLRLASTAFTSVDSDKHSQIAFILVMCGQVIGALAQPIFLSTPAKVSANWFPVDERDMATTITALFNPFGNAIGQVVSPFMVTSEKHPDAGMTRLLLCQAIALTLGFVWCLVGFKSHPPTPPSLSAKIRHDEFLAHPPSSTGAVATLIAHFKELLANRQFNLLLISFSIGLAIFNGLLTVIDQWLKPYGYSNDQAGIAGGVLIVAGLVGAGFAGSLMDTYHAYRPILKSCFTCAFMALVLMCAMLYKHNYPLLLVAFGLMGFFTLPILPGIIENAVECTYPMPEESSSGLLFCCGNVLGIAFTLILAQLVKSDAHHPFTHSNIFLVSCVALCVVVLIPYKGEYKRLHAEAQSSSEERRQSRDKLEDPLIIP